MQIILLTKKNVFFQIPQQYQKLLQNNCKKKNLPGGVQSVNKLTKRGTLSTFSR